VNKKLNQVKIGKKKGRGTKIEERRERHYKKIVG